MECIAYLFLRNYHFSSFDSYLISTCSEHFNQLKMESNVNLLQRQQKHFPRWFKERVSMPKLNRLYNLR